MHNPNEEDWSKLHGQEFNPQELREARDMWDIVANFGLSEDMLKTFVSEKGLKVGQRLFLAMNMPIDQLGVICLNEDDDRIMKVAKARCGDINREADGRSHIFLPGEDNSNLLPVAKEKPKQGRPKLIIP